MNPYEPPQDVELKEPKTISDQERTEAKIIWFVAILYFALVFAYLWSIKPSSVS